MNNINDPTQHGIAPEVEEATCAGCGDLLDGEVIGELCSECVALGFTETLPEGYKAVSLGDGKYKVFKTTEDLEWTNIELVDRMDAYTTEYHMESECGKFVALGTYVHGELVKIEDVEEK